VLQVLGVLQISFDSAGYLKSAAELAGKIAARNYLGNELVAARTVFAAVVAANWTLIVDTVAVTDTQAVAAQRWAVADIKAAGTWAAVSSIAADLRGRLGVHIGWGGIRTSVCSRGWWEQATQLKHT